MLCFTLDTEALYKRQFLMRLHLKHTASLSCFHERICWLPRFERQIWDIDMREAEPQGSNSAVNLSFSLKFLQMFVTLSSSWKFAPSMLTSKRMHDPPP